MGDSGGCALVFGGVGSASARLARPRIVCQPWPGWTRKVVPDLELLPPRENVGGTAHARVAVPVTRPLSALRTASIPADRVLCSVPLPRAD